MPPRWEERTQQRAGPAGRGLLLLPRHLICSLVGSLPLPLLPTAPRHRDALRPNPRAQTAAGTPFDRRAQQAQPDCAPRAAVSVCRPFLTAPTALKPPAKTNSPRLFMPLPPRALRGQVQRVSSGARDTFTRQEWTLSGTRG